MTTAPTSRLRRAAATLLPAALAFGGVTGVAGPAAANDQYGGDAAPITVITAGPADGSTVFTSPVVFEFDAIDLDFTGSPATFQCSLSGPGILGLYFPCSSPKSYNLSAAGSYTFRVKATVDGETDPTPESRTFTYDPPAPQTMINSGPADGSTVTTSQVTFGFSSPSPGNVTFECKLQGPRGLAGFDPCTSPETVTLGYDGDYTFSVRAIRDGEADPTPATRTFTYVDNVDASPASRTFTYSPPAPPPPPDTTPPETEINGGPAEGATVTSPPSYTFSSPSADTAGFRCAVDNEAFQSCTSPRVVDAGPGTHTFRVAAVDGAGNVDPSPATRSFVLSTTEPPPVDEECEEAKDRLAAKKARLQQLKEADAPKRKIRKVKRQIRRLKALVAEVC